MRNFRRSLRYLWPYRKRLAVAVGCVILIAGLWGGGLGLLLPGTKILISTEGLHGWAWRTLTQDKLGIRFVQRRPPAQAPIEGETISDVIDVVTVEAGGPAGRAGIRPSEWIVGFVGGDGTVRLRRADVLARRLAQAKAGRRMRLRLYDPQGGTARTVEVTMGPEGLGARLLGRVAGAVDEPRTPLDKFRMLTWLLVIGVAITVFRDVLRFGQEYLVQSAVYRGMMDLRCDNYNVSLHLPVTFFASQGTSDTMSRFVQDTNELAHGHVTLFGKTLVEPAKAVGSIVTAMFFSWQLTLLAMVAGPPAFILIRKFGKRMRRASRRALESWAGMLAVLEETLAGIRVVKAYTMEAAERRRFFEVNRRLLRQQKRMAAVDAATAPSVEALGVTAGMMAAGAAGYMVFTGQMDPESLLVWMACLAAMFDPLRKLAKVATRFHRAEAAAARVFELHDQPQEKRRRRAASLPRHHACLEFRGVSFRYPGADDDALREIDLSIPAGRTVAIVGPNGSGKTTLVSLVPRLIDPTRGAVLIDGTDVAEVSLRSLRRQIGLVTQETVLFHATIAQNVAYGLRRPKREQVLEAARKAYVDEFVRDLRDGYETMVGERGATLSGGQRQRVAIARAILRDPAILIFDEAMSQIDADSEQRIHQAMKEFIRGRTTLLIAHRFATVLSADRVVVMDEGRIIDGGGHEELLERCELYRQLYTTQLAGADPA